jgi:hypothetical protein
MIDEDEGGSDGGDRTSASPPKEIRWGAGLIMEESDNAMPAESQYSDPDLSVSAGQHRAPDCRVYMSPSDPSGILSQFDMSARGSMSFVGQGGY